MIDKRDFMELAERERITACEAVQRLEEACAEQASCAAEFFYGMYEHAEVRS